MDVQTVTCVTYSPTRTTYRVVSAIANGLGASTITDVDLTWRKVGIKVTVAADDVAVFGVPVYVGRVAATAVERLRSVKGRGTPALLVAVYGNRAYEDALVELSDLVTAAGFVPVAAAAFIGEHSYTTEATPIAVGRPDAQDLEQACAFGRSVRALLEGMPRSRGFAPLVVPGNRPYRRGVRESDTAPSTQAKLCTLCGLCADACPVGAISVSETVETDGLACTLCSACIRVCPTGARVMKDEGVLKTARWLATEHSERKEPVTFLT